ncbi:MAG: helicase, partial [Mesorhizobium sp.]
KPAWAVLAAIESAQEGEEAREFRIVQRNWSRVAGKDKILQTLVAQRRDADEITWLSTGELNALVDMALGAPGVVVGRALYRHLPELFDYREQHFFRLAHFCWTRLRTYLDRPVFWSVLPGEDAMEKFQQACIDGCLEAVLDEHFWLRKSKVNPKGLIDDLSAALAANVGTFGFKGTRRKEKIRIRCHAAVPFGGTEAETHREGKD